MSSRTEILDAIKKMNVMELAELIKDIETTFGVSAAAPVAAAAAIAAPAAAAEEKNEYKVTLLDAGANKINVIKALRSVTSLSLGDAKNGAENVPFVVSEAASKDDAQKIKKTLEEAGGKIELA